MAVPMDNASELSSRELVQRLYNKNVELENKRRRSAQSRISSDPNLWQRMRENFETIILEDYAFAEQHEIEFALWQLHYGRIEELRGHFNRAMAPSSSSPTGQGGKTGAVHSDRIAKIRSQFKTFLSEATGFYHELILKIRAKHGLPLGFFSDDPENEAVVSKEGIGSTDLKKGLISCHRCLIYLGDLARYKGIYGEGEFKSRDFAAASSYYMQASSCCPSSGNPHHQLAILASYSSDEFVAIYRYFRSLAVDNPFPMARDNLIIAFEKNRQNFSQLIGNAKTSAAKPVAVRNGKGRGRAETRFSGKDQKVEGNPVKEGQPSAVDTLKAFSVKFVRLNGILFTRTSMETFADVLNMAKTEFLELLLSRSEEDHSFGSDAAESGLFIVRLVAILIFTVHNANRDSEDQSYAEILQRTVLLQNAYSAAFEFMGHIIEKCMKYHDTLSSFLLPGVLVFLEWIACHPEVVTRSEEEKLANVRTFFWNGCVSLFNKLISAGLIHEDEDETCFFNMGKYEEGETANRLALWEDFELRGFLPLKSAQQVLDFSRKHSFGNDSGNKEKKSRVQRIVAAAKAFSSVVRVGQQVVYFDPKLKKFAIGMEPRISRDVAVSSAETHELNRVSEDIPAKVKLNSVVLEPASIKFVDGEDEEEEEIVFKPSVADKQADGIVPTLTPSDSLRTAVDASLCDVGNCVGSVSASHGAILAQSTFRTSTAISAPLSNGVALHAFPSQSSSSNWLLEQEASVMNGFRNFSLMEDWHSMSVKLQEQYGALRPSSLSHSFMQPVKHSAGSLEPVPEAAMLSNSQSNLSSVSLCDGASIKQMSVSPVGAKKNPVGRPLRHIGPPPGFTPASANHCAGMTMKNDNPLMDDYSWLDGYQMLSTTLSSGLNSLTNLSREACNSVSKGSSMAGMVSFPFPGKQASSFQVPVENSKRWQDYQFRQPLDLYQEHQNKNQFMQKGNQQPMPLQKQFQRQSLSDGYFLV